MTTVASKIIADCQRELQDEAGIRWPAAELVDYLNDGQRLIVTVNRGASAAEDVLTLVDGAAQQAPAGVAEVMDVLANADGRRKAIRQVSRALLDATEPGWMARSPASEVAHFMKDAHLPRAFEVYPPARAGTRVLCKLSMLPVDVAPPTGPVAADVSGNISLRAEYSEPLRHYVLFRAWSKDAEYGGNAASAQAHYGLFSSSIGADVAAAASTNEQPTT